MKWLLMLAVGVVWLGLVGCGPTETVPSCPDPRFGEVDEACGVWVSASLGDDANPGTRLAPKASLTAAAAQAFDNNQDVYACGELWTEPLILSPSVSLYGGFDCEDGWTYRGEARRARLETGPGEIPLKTSGAAGQRVIADFTIRAADAIVPGGSSIAVLVADPQIIHFLRCSILAGRGADGLDGEEMEEPAMAGAAGIAGADACATVAGPGGAATETACGAEESSRGGKGGDGGAMLATDGEAGLPAPGEKDPGNPQDGDGGKGQTGAVGCTPGEPGADGVEGVSGEHVLSSKGRVSADGFTGQSGADGQPGTPAQGGGGGGASRGGAAVCGAATPGGAGGGAGGAGGCGGKAGKGGQAGGSSFAVLLFLAGRDATFESCDLWVSRAGNGGDGAKGQPGGPGGEPGLGGAAQGSLQAGCQGGKGGTGGKGGGGAGGNGGHVFHIVYDGGDWVYPWPDTTYNGQLFPGDGGAGGDPFGAERGADGYASKGTYLTSIYSFQQ